jgi:hypothetical protein
MKRILVIAVILVFGLWTGLARGDTPTLPTTANITNNSLVQTYLKLAVRFWHAEYPALIPPCSNEQVFVGEMEPGASVNGTILPASQVWAETFLGTCNIYVVSLLNDYLQELNSVQQWEVCIVIAHEYGHTLGLPDETAIPMMSQNWKRRDDPLCVQYIYGWENTSHTDREWLAWHHLAKPHDRGIAP